MGTNIARLTFCFRALVQVELGVALVAVIVTIPCTKLPVAQELHTLCDDFCWLCLLLVCAQAPLPRLDLPASDKLGSGIPRQAGIGHPHTQPVRTCTPRASRDRASHGSRIRICTPQASRDRASPSCAEPGSVPGDMITCEIKTTSTCAKYVCV